MKSTFECVKKQGNEWVFWHYHKGNVYWSKTYSTPREASHARNIRINFLNGQYPIQDNQFVDIYPKNIIIVKEANEYFGVMSHKGSYYRTFDTFSNPKQAMQESMNLFTQVMLKAMTPQQRINNAMSSHIHIALKKKTSIRKWTEYVNYSLDDLIHHLEEQFQPGMSWENYGQWHIDHKIPVSWWQFTSPNDREFKQCWALANLQPLWATENIKKGNRHSLESTILPR